MLWRSCFEVLPSLGTIDKGPAWTARLVRTQSCAFVLLAVYFVASIGPTAENVTLLFQLASYLRLLGLPWVACGDWNMTASELESLGWLALVEGMPMLPQGATTTCASGHRVIDFAVASYTARGLFAGCSLDWDGAWAPHWAFKLGLSVSPQSVLMRRLVPPPSLGCGRSKRVGPARCWDACVDDARARARLLVGTVQEAVRSYALPCLDPGWAAACEFVSLDYLDWALAAEHALDAPAGRTRGAPAVVVLARAQPKQRECCVAYACPEAATFSRLAQRLRSLVALRTKGHGLRQQLDIATWLEEQAEGEARDLLVERCGQGAGLAMARRLAAALVQPLGAVSALANKATALSKRASATFAAKKPASFRAWLDEALQRGARKAHRFCKEVDFPLPSLEVTPLAAVAEVRAFWATYWCRDDALAHGVRSAMHELRLLAGETEPLAAPCAVEMRRGLATLKKDTATSTDVWSPAELESLPDEGLVALGRVFHSIEVVLALPIQVLVAIMALLAKPLGGFRTIALLGMVYRLWARVRKWPVAEWEDGFVGHWDTAVRGSSALRAAVARAFAAEYAVALGATAATVYWDIEKFYDSVALDLLIPEAVRFGYPPRLLYVTLLAHLGPRRLRLAGCLSEEVWPSASLAAGCGRANTLARVVLYAVLDEAHKQLPLKAALFSAKQFVDDVTTSFVGVPRVVAAAVACAGDFVVARLQALRLKVSVAKLKLVASSGKAYHELRGCLATAGLDMPCDRARAAADLGAPAGGGRLRRVGVFLARLRGAVRRALRIARLARVRPQACKLFRTGAWPAGSYAAAAQGASPANIRTMRRAAAKATGIRASGRCATTAIALRLNGQGDPGVLFPVDQVKAWLQLWFDSEDVRAQAPRIWGKTLLKVAPPRGRWAKIAGPAAATVAVLVELGWWPAQAARWRDNFGDEWEVADARYTPAFLRHLAKHAELRLWVKAASHHCGGGLERGVDLVVTKRHLEGLLQREEFGLHGMLATILSAGLWTRQRKHRAGLVDSPTCPRCGAADEDEAHMFWSCSENGSIEDIRVTSTQHLAGEALRGHFPCFWMRGLLPQDWVDAEAPDVGPLKAWVLHPGLGFGCGEEVSTVFTDGSGGEYSSEPRLRRCGWSLAEVRLAASPPVLVQGLFGTLPGVAQTVNRAELFAALQAVLLFTGELVVHTDSAYVFNLASRFPADLDVDANLDLWDELWTALSVRTMPVTWVKVKSHADEPAWRANRVTTPLAIGNTYADTLAGVAAERACDSRHAAFVALVRWLDSRTLQVQKRLLAIALVCCANVVRVRRAHLPRKARLCALQHAAEAAGHLVSFAGAKCKLRCCGIVVPKRRLGAWLRVAGASCRPSLQMPVDAEVPLPPPPDCNIRVGSQDVHTSHAAAVYRGVVWCWKCGAWGTRKLQRLAAECKPPTARGLRVRKRLREGKTPQQGFEWPEEAGRLAVFPRPPPGLG